jgi:hypothetical protein
VLNTSDLTQWSGLITRIASDLVSAPKILLYCTEYNWPTTVLWMCPHAWQDQYNLHKKGMTPMDMCLLQTSLKGIKHMCTQEKAHVQSGEKASLKSETETKRPSFVATKQVSKKVCFEKSCKLCKKHGGVHTTHAIKDHCKNEKDGIVNANFCAAKKAGKKSNPAKQSFAQLSLSKKLEKLEESLKKASLKSKKRRRDNGNSVSE